MKLRDQDTISIPPNGLPQESQPRWRQDFPIDIPQDEYVSRRDFTKYMVLISFAFVVGQLWIVLQNLVRQKKGKDFPTKEIARIDEMQIGQVRIFEYPEKHDACVLVRTGRQDFLAYSQICTHLSCPVIPDPGNGVFHCPCHEGLFEMGTGIPLAGPPQRPLPKIRLQITGNKIYAVGIEAPA
jgi:Rieske Fe-S protein